MAASLKYNPNSEVEIVTLKRSGRKFTYPPTEKIRVLEIESYPILGQVTALRFIEWVKQNPGGAIALPTGKTPEYFIKWVDRILAHWNSKEIRSLLESYHIDPTRKPDMKNLRFVQIDEFYPMNARHHNSFNYYVNEFYIKGFGLSPQKAMLIDATNLGLPPQKTMADIFPDNIVDLTLRVRQTKTQLERMQKETINRVDEFCMEYESKIRNMGGIGFFLGGIGPDGHIAFNVRGSSFYSVTRLTGTNYETQAAVATDLGGIEISRNRLVITIGLSTISYNPTVKAIIIAAGEAKATIVRQAIEEKKNPQYPASVLQDLEYSRFYLTKGAASLLHERRFIDFANTTKLSDEKIDDVMIAIARSYNKAVKEITTADLKLDKFGNQLIKKTKSTAKVLSHNTHVRIVEKIQRGLERLEQTTFLHTEPHQDDIMLGYLAYIYHLVREPNCKHYFANLTSGFTSVSNEYFLTIILKLEKFLSAGSFNTLLRQGYFAPGFESGRMADVYLFLDGAASRRQEWKDEGEARRMLRNIVDQYHTTHIKTIRSKIANLTGYLQAQYPGAKDSPPVQTLKGTLREWEVELLWAYFGIEASAVHALRLGFYQGDIFSEEPEINRDVLPIYNLLKKIKPDIVSVAFDPEGSGPDTHYKALQAVAAALKMYEQKSKDSSIRVWGYRNVWYRFKPSEANIMVPVSLNTLSLLQTAFTNCFGSQRAASFPSYEHDGPFSELAQKIHVEQYEMIKTCLGNDYFLNNPHPRLRAARGMIFLREMSLPEFYEKVRELKNITEARI
ncbi:MAG: glucosamine-6-phosphate deaminase [Bacteroidota bacterium]